MPYSNPVSITRLGPALLLSLLLCTPVAFAVDGSEQSRTIEALKRQVLDLQTRVERLEGEVEQGGAVNIARTLEPVPGGWRKEANWKLLVEGMTSYRVREILGEPETDKTVKKFEFWEYGNGKVRLYLGRLKNWDLPTGLDAE